MLAAAAIVWITLDADAATPRADVGRGWSAAAVGEASFRPLFVYPDFQSGLVLLGGFGLSHQVTRGATFALRGRAGATLVDDWRPLFEAAAELSWRDRLELRSGLRHDDRLRREGALADFRDPTGRVFLEVVATPFHMGPLAVGGSADYERALPGVGHLPSGLYGSAVARLTWRR
jgi:hypothetical protein